MGGRIFEQVSCKVARNCWVKSGPGRYKRARIGSMWIRLVKLLRCPMCKHELECSPFKRASIEISKETLIEAERRWLLGQDFNDFVDDGLLLCHHCKALFPILRGVPVLLSYMTEVHSR